MITLIVLATFCVGIDQCDMIARGCPDWECVEQIEVEAFKSLYLTDLQVTDVVTNRTFETDKVSRSLAFRVKRLWYQ